MVSILKELSLVATFGLLQLGLLACSHVTDASAPVAAVLRRESSAPVRHHGGIALNVDGTGSSFDLQRKDAPPHRARHSSSFIEEVTDARAATVSALAQTVLIDARQKFESAVGMVFGDDVSTGTVNTPQALSETSDEMSSAIDPTVHYKTFGTGGCRGASAPEPSGFQGGIDKCMELCTENLEKKGVPCTAFSYKMTGDGCAVWTEEPSATDPSDITELCMKKTDKAVSASPRRRRRAELAASKVPTGEFVCENAELTEGQCKNLGCCAWENNECHSAVGNAPCKQWDQQGDKAATAQALDCSANLHNWKEAWSQSKKDYCCSKKNVGCKDGQGYYGADPTHDLWSGSAECICAPRAGMASLPNPLFVAQPIRSFAEQFVTCAGIEKEAQCTAKVSCKWNDNPALSKFPKCMAKKTIAFLLDTDMCGWATDIFKADPCTGLEPCVTNGNGLDCTESHEENKDTCEMQKVCKQRNFNTTTVPKTAYPKKLLDCVGDAAEFRVKGQLEKRTEKERDCMIENLPGECSIRKLLECERKTTMASCGPITCSWENGISCLTGENTAACKPSIIGAANMGKGDAGDFFRRTLTCYEKPSCGGGLKTAALGAMSAQSVDTQPVGGKSKKAKPSPISYLPLLQIVLAIVFGFFYKSKVVDLIPELPDQKAPRSLFGADFDVGVFECCTDNGIMLHTLFCPCARQAHTMQVIGGSYWCTFIASIILFPCFSVLVLVQRSQVRSKLDLSQACISDFILLIICCCAPCAVGQQAMSVDRKSKAKVTCCFNLEIDGKSPVVGAAQAAK